jgi:hypothetical protein
VLISLTDTSTHCQRYVHYVRKFLCNLQVNAFRSMMHDDMMVGAFSHSTAVGKLRQDLPDVPVNARLNLPRYTLDEAATVCHYYLRYAKDIDILARIVLLLIVLCLIIFQSTSAKLTMIGDCILLCSSRNLSLLYGYLWISKNISQFLQDPDFFFFSN